MSTTSFAVKFYKGEKLQKGFFPIVLQITYSDKNDKTTSSRIRLGYKAKENQWDFDNDRFTNNDEVNRELDEREKIAEKIYQAHFSKREFDFKEYTILYRNGMNTSFSHVLDKYVEFERNKNASWNTIIYYDVTIRKSIYNHFGEIAIKNITPESLEKYGSTQTSDVHFRGLKAIYRFALRKGFIEQKDYPLKGDYNPNGYSYKHLTSNNRKDKEPELAYTQEELEIFANYKPNKREQRAWDTFMLSYYFFGANLLDIIHFTDRNNRGGGLVFVRSKTGITVRMPIMQEARSIIERYKNDTYWFPVVDADLPEEGKKKKEKNYLRSVNRTLKKIAKKIGTDTRIKFYTARHTAATIAIKKGAPIQEVSALLGHKTILTTQIYLAQFDIKELSNTMQLLSVR